MVTSKVWLLTRTEAAAVVTEKACKWSTIGLSKQGTMAQVQAWMEHSFCRARMEKQSRSVPAKRVSCAKLTPHCKRAETP